ncbi:ATP-binding protein [Roseofilum capinflatum]|uniref:ATP-binding protein n=1 Tax=Roseofilum capinflatum BLCC-M114 TaxID=3022440 RepID=A0ABT7BCQ5_9CYAN|nr:ATP-binding protein [Roseofilum capinflatum]MDJ1176941.1 ATP-binding protein [Roseofilum capinflatum BLCC-M114]
MTSNNNYVGTLVGESTSSEFRLAVTPETIQEQDIIAVDAELNAKEKESSEPIRIWAKVQRIERMNPLFPQEAGHELAYTQTNPFDTVMSLSRDMVTAICKILGYEFTEDISSGKLKKLRYPPKPATNAYRPDSKDIARIVVGELKENSKNDISDRALDIATLSNRDINVKVDGHAIVSRHLAILAMTGAGKSWTSRRIIEQLAIKNYPIVIFDPHGDYTGLSDIPEIQNKVKRYYAQFPVFEQESDTIASIVSSLGYELTDAMKSRFDDVFKAASCFIVDDPNEMQERTNWLSDKINKPDLKKYGIKPDLWLIANLAEAGESVLQNDSKKVKTDNEDQKKLEEWGWSRLSQYSGTDKRTLEGIKKRTYTAAKELQGMEQRNKKYAAYGNPLPKDRTELVNYGQISIISLTGYTDEFRATIYSIIANDIFESKVKNDLTYPVLLLLEEAHNFAPGKPNTIAEQKAITVTKKIAQEGRKFGVGLMLVSQRPSRLDETTLAMCNSYIVMRMLNPADQSFIRKVIENLGEEETKMLPDLEVGEAILSGQFTSFPILVKMKPPESQGEREEKNAFDTLEEEHRKVVAPNNRKPSKSKR